MVVGMFTGSQITVFVGGLGSTTGGNTDGIGTNAKFSSPRGITYAGSGIFYFVNANVVRKIVVDASGGKQLVCFVIFVVNIKNLVYGLQLRL
jgi:hypothetical protein